MGVGASEPVIWPGWMCLALESEVLTLLVLVFCCMNKKKKTEKRNPARMRGTPSALLEGIPECIPLKGDLKKWELVILRMEVALMTYNKRIMDHGKGVWPELDEFLRNGKLTNYKTKPNPNVYW